MEVESQGQQNLSQTNHSNTEKNQSLTGSVENQAKPTEENIKTDSATHDAADSTNIELKKNDQESKNESNHEDKMIVESHNGVNSGKLPRIFVYGSSECDQFYIDGIKFITKKPLEISSHFINIKKTVYSIACGELHTMFLLTNGDLYTSGCNNFHALGRSGDETRPGKVELEFPIDMISAGELHSVACNSANSIVYQWGVYRNGQRQNVSTAKTPSLVGDEEFSGKKIKKILSGLNHTILLADGKVFIWGNLDDGVIGKQTSGRRSQKTGLHVHELNVTGVEDIFTGGQHVFLVQSRKKKSTKKNEEETETVLMALGSNDFGQLGVKTRKKLATLTEVKELKDLDVKKIKDIKGGKNHTLILTKDGDVYGLGNNERGELGATLQVAQDKVSEYPDTMVFKEVGGRTTDSRLISTAVPLKLELSNIQQIFAGNNYNYAIDAEQKVYSWGVGDNYILGDRKEEIVNKAKQMDSDFLEGKPVQFGLGFQHVVAVTAEEVPVEMKLDEEVFKVCDEADLAEKKKVILERMPKEEPVVEEEKKEEQPKKATRSRSKAKKETEMEEENEKEEEEEDNEEEEEEEKPKKDAKKTRGKSQTTKKEVNTKKKEKKEEEEDEEEEEEEEKPKKDVKKARGRSQPKKETAAKDKKKAATRSGSKTKGKAKAKVDEDEMEEEEEEEEQKEEPRKTRGRSQTTKKEVNAKKEEKKEKSQSKGRNVAKKSAAKPQKTASRSISKSTDKKKTKENAPVSKKEPEVNANTRGNARKRRTERDEDDDGELKKVKKTTKSKSVTAKTKSKSTSKRK